MSVASSSFRLLLPAIAAVICGPRATPATYLQPLDSRQLLHSLDAWLAGH